VAREGVAASTAASSSALPASALEKAVESSAVYAAYDAALRLERVTEAAETELAGGAVQAAAARVASRVGPTSYGIARLGLCDPIIIKEKSLE